MSRQMAFALALLVAVGVVAAADEAYRAEVRKWRAERETRLKADGGWLSVAGLFWYSHQRRLAYAPEANRFTVIVNLLFLLSIILLPVTTGLYGTYPSAEAAIVRINIDRAPAEPVLESMRKECPAILEVNVVSLAAAV